MTHHMGELYLLIPTGQALATDNRPLKLNESGAFLWEKLQSEVTEAELLEQLKEEYGGVPQERLEADLTSFLRTLRERKMLDD